MPAALRPLSVGEILDAAVHVYRGHFGALATVVVACNSAPLLLNVYIQAAGGGRANLGLQLIYFVLFTGLSAIATAATVFIVSESYLGRAITAREALSRAAPFLGRVVAASLLVAFAVIVGFLLLIVPGVIALSGLVLTPPALVLESLPSATAGLSRSWALTEHSRARMLGLLLLLGLILLLPWLAVTGLVGLLGAFVVFGGRSGGLAVSLLVGAVIAGLVQMLLYPITHAALTITYYDLRVRKEGFDLEVLASTLKVA